MLHQTVLRLSGGGLQSSLSIDAVFAPFSPPPAESVLGPVVLSVPPTADKPLENEEDLKGRFVVLFQGKCARVSVLHTNDLWRVLLLLLVVVVIPFRLLAA